jgi:hypothetical protein
MEIVLSRGLALRIDLAQQQHIPGRQSEASMYYCQLAGIQHSLPLSSELAKLVLADLNADADEILRSILIDPNWAR